MGRDQFVAGRQRRIASWSFDDIATAGVAPLSFSTNATPRYQQSS
jgi:hypothetical protein